MMYYADEYGQRGAGTPAPTPGLNPAPGLPPSARTPRQGGLGYSGYAYDDGSVFKDPDPLDRMDYGDAAHPGPREKCATWIGNPRRLCKRVEGAARTFTTVEQFRGRYPTLPTHWGTQGAKGKWPAQRMLKANAPTWTGSQRWMFSLALYYEQCIRNERERATNAPAGPQSTLRLSLPQRAELKSLIGLGAPRTKAEKLRGYRLLSGGVLERIINAPVNIAGAHGLPYGGSCWYYSKPAGKILPRWIAGGGPIGPLVDKILPPPDFLGLFPDPVTGEPTWVPWSIEEVFDFFEINPLNCTGYFAGLRRDFERIAKIFAQAGMPGCAEVAESAKENVPAPHKTLHVPGPYKFPWKLGLGALALYALIKSGAAAGLISAATKRDAPCYNKKKERIRCPK